MKKFLLFALLLCATLTVSAQNSSKLSGRTRIMLSKYGQQDDVNQQKRTLKVQDAKVAQLRAVAEKASVDVAPVNVAGKNTVPVWIQLKDNNFSALKNIEGVEVTAEFDKMVTAAAALSSLEKIAALKNVIKVSVAQKEQIQTAETRIATNVDDILNFSQDAQDALLDKAYDGTGVIMGIVDQGIQFDHIQFKDRIKLALVWDATSGHMVKKTGSEISALTYIYNGLHGSHVASIAAGSNQTISGSYYDYTKKTTVTGGNRTYGGMAPGTDLVLCDMGSGLSTVAYAECIKAISDYAAEVGKPFVINMSVGGLQGPHNGKTGVAHEAIAQCATGPGKAVVIATGNYANREKPWATGNISATSTFRTVVELTAYKSYTSGSYTMKNMYHDGVWGVYARTPNVDLVLDLDVIDTKTNEVLFRWNDITEDVTLSCRSGDNGVEGIEYDENLAMMFQPINDEEGYGRLYITFDKDADGRASIEFEAAMMNTLQSTDYFTKSGNTYTGHLYFAINVRPKELGSTAVDAFGPGADFISGSYTYAGDDKTYTYIAGSNKCCMTDLAVDLNSISVGSWVMSNQWWSKNSTSSTTSYSTTRTIGSVHENSGYQTVDAPSGEALPFILAPGTPVIAAGNRYATGQTSSNSWIPTGSATTNPLYVNSGTSMAAPVVAGICALLLQADPTRDINGLKGLLGGTATKDSHTTGAEAGPNGKVDALAAMARLFQNASAIISSTNNVTISKTAAGTYTEKITVRGYGLSEDIKVTLIDPNGYFAVDKTSVARATAEGAGETLTITYTTGEEGEFIGKVLLQSKDCKDVEIILNGSYISDGTASNNYLNMNYWTTMDDAGWKSMTAGTQDKVTGCGFKETSDGGWVTANAYALYMANMPVKDPKLQPWEYHTGWVNASMTHEATDVFLGSNAYGTSWSTKWIKKENTSTPGLAQLHVSGIDEYRGLINVTGTSGVVYTVYECTENADKTINVGTTVVKTLSKKTTGDKQIATITGLDPNKIYEIKIQCYQGGLYEHAFHIASANPTVYINDTEATHTTLNIATKTSAPSSVTFNVFSENLQSDVTIQLIDDNNVYSLDRTSVSIADAKKTSSALKGNSVKASSKGQDVTVTLESDTEGDYPALLVLTSTRMTPVTVAINGSVEYDPLTGIVGVTDPEQDKNGVWYTIQGLRLKGAPTTKGVYIFNGRKILVN